MGSTQVSVNLKINVKRSFGRSLGQDLYELHCLSLQTCTISNVYCGAIYCLCFIHHTCLNVMYYTHCLYFVYTTSVYMLPVHFFLYQISCWILDSMQDLPSKNGVPSFWVFSTTMVLLLLWHDTWFGIFLPDLHWLPILISPSTWTVDTYPHVCMRKPLTCMCTCHHSHDIHQEWSKGCWPLTQKQHPCHPYCHDNWQWADSQAWAPPSGNWQICWQNTHPICPLAVFKESLRGHRQWHLCWCPVKKETRNDCKATAGCILTSACKKTKNNKSCCWSASCSHCLGYCCHQQNIQQ